MIGVSVTGIDDVVLNLKKVDVKVTKGVNKETAISASRVLSDAKNTVPVAWGKLRSSGHVKPIPKGHKAEFESNYARYVEFGRRAGKFPPIDPIRDWVRKVGMASGENVNSIAFLVARKIAQKGTRKQPFLRPAFERERMRFKRNVLRLVK